MSVLIELGKNTKRGFGEMGKGRDFWMGESLHDYY